MISHLFGHSIELVIFINVDGLLRLDLVVLAHPLPGLAERLEETLVHVLGENGLDGRLLHLVRDGGADLTLELLIDVGLQRLVVGILDGIAHHHKDIGVFARRSIVAQDQPHEIVELDVDGLVVEPGIQIGIEPASLDGRLLIGVSLCRNENETGRGRQLITVDAVAIFPHHSVVAVQTVCDEEVFISHPLLDSLFA